MKRALGLGAWLVLVWIALWGEATVANLLSGMAVAAFIVASTSEELPRSGFTVRPLPALRFLGYFLYKLIEANVIVAWEVVTPGNRINLGIVEVPLRQSDDALITLVANAVTLTPGTLTLEVERAPDGACALYVHVLHLHSVEETRQDILRLEELAVEAFGSEAARRALAGTKGSP